MTAPGSSSSFSPLTAPGSSSSFSPLTAPSSSSSGSPLTAPASSKDCLLSSSRAPTNFSPQSASKTRSVLADILNLPKQTPTGRRKTKTVSGAKVLTSIEARRILEEKERKKKKEREEKERKKQEREQKKLQRQEEQRKKQEQRAAKQVECQKPTQERAKRKPSWKHNCFGASSSATKSKKNSDSDMGLQRREVSSNECAVCFGLYDEDVNSETGDLMSDWIQCTNNDCAVWVHTECLDKCDGDYVCRICETLFC